MFSEKCSIWLFLISYKSSGIYARLMPMLNNYKYFNMQRLTILYILGVMFLTTEGLAQVGEKVSAVNVLNMENDTVGLPMFGQKDLLIFYADPSHPRQNKSFREYFKTHPIDNPNVDSYGVINMAAARLIPNAMIRKMAMKETKGTDAKIYLDPDHLLSRAWKLPGADKNFTVIFVNKDKVIEFYKAGQLTPREEDQVMALIKKYEAK